MHPATRKQLSRLAWGVILSGCLGIGLLPYVDFLAGGWLPKLQAFQPFLLLLPVLALVLGIVRRHWIFSGFVALSLVLGTMPIIQTNPAGVHPEASQNGMNVLAFNSLKASADPTALAELIGKADPDLLILVESSEQLHRKLESRGALGAFGYRTEEVVDGGERDTVIFSKYSLKEKTRELDSTQTGWYSLPVAQVQTPQGLINVAGIHIYPPVGDAKRWKQGLEAVGTWARQETNTPVILAGDFNAVRAHPGFRDMKTGFVDADGFLPAATWPADRKISSLIGIDHILVRDLAVAEFSVHKVEGSDHLAISATLGVE
ncbi:endonuclease/exonuclease/phosphatase family protein [Glutamicibacter uratoxydans]|uniref:endonuclease/exonuclease/phosphatase family protein n=1 Tax=Glutamicibacter uratoxydans TaxID=43667 RepID=UPI003D6EEA5B